jgi:rfaE bifunctional protein kinase chain/domain
MISFSRNRLESLFKAFDRQTIMVVGDLMLDRYMWGSVRRISPEAPVPVVDIESESVRFGGAANVIHNIKTLGADVIPVGVIGKDSSGETLKALFREKGFSCEGVLEEGTRPTTVKTRVIAHNQHVVRTDREIRHGISKPLQDRLLSFIRSRIGEVDGVILEDYNKGLLMPQFIRAIVQLARERKKKVLVDPKFDHFFDYKNVTLFKPNRKEVSERLGVRMDTDADLEKTGRKLMSKLQCEALLITLGEKGIALFEPDGSWTQVPTKAVKVHDVSGAGDTVIATMAVALTSGATLQEAATLANHGAGLVCGEVGIVPVEKERLFQVMLEETEK